jgi:hypothetical protein
MPPISKPLRKQLEASVREARDAAEAGAKAALTYLGAGRPEAPS